MSGRNGGKGGERKAHLDGQAKDLDGRHRVYARVVMTRREWKRSSNAVCVLCCQQCLVA